METALPAIALCPNCQSELTGRFCSDCGQENFGHEPNLKELVADVWSNMFSVDGRLISTLKSMVKAPGQLTLEYFEGRRVRYVTPFKLYLTCSAAFFLVANFSTIQMRIQKNGVPATEKDVDDKTGQMIIAVIKEGSNYFFNHLPTIFLFVVPITALSTALLFAGRKRNLLFHLVFVLHVWSAVFLVGAIINVCHIPINFFQTLLIGGFLYGSWAASRAFRAKWWEAGIKGFLFSLSSVIMLLVPLLVIVMTVAMKKKAEGMKLSLGPSTTFSSSESTNNSPSKK